MPERRVLDLERLAGIHQNAGVNHGDVRVPLEVGGVERAQVSHAVNLHGSGQPGVMNLNAQDGMGDHETTPFAVDGLAIRQEHHSLFDRADFPLSASAGVNPNPFRFAGRVATFQNSAMF